MPEFLVSADNPLILASQSPRRRQLLEWAEIPFRVEVIPTNETYPDGLEIESVPIHIARQKALAVQEKFGKETVVLAADTIVVLDNEVIGKPGDKAEAINTLNRLANTTHRVITGVTIRKGNVEIAFSETTKVSFHPLTREQIQHYVEKYQPYDKAGAYAIQEWIGVVGISGIEGDYYNVVGLPVSRVVQYFTIV